MSKITSFDAAARRFSRGELMVAAAAREIHDGKVGFVGMCLPVLGWPILVLKERK